VRESRCGEVVACGGVALLVGKTPGADGERASELGKCVTFRLSCEADAGVKPTL
jgi:hypothetical protein